MGTRHWNLWARVILAALLAGVLLPQWVLARGGLSPAALVGGFAIGFAGGMLLGDRRWLALIPLAVAGGIAVRYIAAIDRSPYGSNAGIPGRAIYGIIALIAVLHALMAMSAAMVALVAAHLPGRS